MRPRQIEDDELVDLLPSTVMELAEQSPIGKAAIHYRLQRLADEGIVERVAGSWPHVWKRKGT